MQINSKFNRLFTINITSDKIKKNKRNFKKGVISHEATRNEM